MAKHFARTVQQHGPWIRPLLRSHARGVDPADLGLLRDISAYSRDGQLVSLDIPGPARGYAVIRESEPKLLVHLLPTENNAAARALFLAIAEASNYERHVVDPALVSDHTREAIEEVGAAFGITLGTQEPKLFDQGGWLEDGTQESSGAESDGSTSEETVTLSVSISDEPHENFEVERGSKLALDEPEREGFTFDGWELFDGGLTGVKVDSEYVLDRDTMVVATWTTTESGAVESDGSTSEETVPEGEELSEEELQALIDESPYAKMRRAELEKIAKRRSIFIPKKIDDLRRALFESEIDTEPFES